MIQKRFLHTRARTHAHTHMFTAPKDPRIHDLQAHKHKSHIVDLRVYIYTSLTSFTLNATTVYTCCYELLDF
jgi:hypothetical protein